MSNRRAQSGFTLIELMIVMAIIGILITLAIPSFVGAVRHAREAALKEDLQTMRTAIDT
ncbi:MAG TPA: prepilin-type N-terminal cleavage/methylation domain-containing protein, partial [Terracidiphilus sp.]